MKHITKFDNHSAYQLAEKATPNVSLCEAEYEVHYSPYVEPPVLYVDLGLPSGTLWAKGNIVKDSNDNYSIGEETDYGAYFSWGNIDGHNEGEGYNFNSTTYNSTSGKSLTADIASNDAAHDAALAHLGANWRMPTKEEFKELYNNCTSEWTTVNGVAGRRFTSKINGESIFIPTAGYYDGTSLYSRGTYGYFWSSSYSSSLDACYLSFNRTNIYYNNGNYRNYGFSIRPVVRKSSGSYGEAIIDAWH